MESINAKATGKFVQLSEQQLIDCDRGPPFDDNGCHAGWVDGGWSYLIKNGGQAALSRYPNTGWEASCNKKAESKSAPPPQMVLASCALLWSPGCCLL